MKQEFSTGELAKLCNVSTRTVQYYDRLGLLKPSVKKGANRIYTGEELKRLHCICLYKGLGFSLEEIDNIINKTDNHSLIELLTRQQTKIDNELENLQQTKMKISAALDQLQETGRFTVENIEAMNQLLIKKEAHRKTDIMTYLFLAGYLLLLIAGFPISLRLGGFLPYIMSALAVLTLLGLIYYHSQVNGYFCPDCHTKFSIGFVKDLVTPNGAKYGKYLKCPKCGKRGWFKETFPE